jgi:hypothetical protein
MAFIIPNSQLFLNHLKDEEITKLEIELYESGSFDYLVNHRHIYDSITMDQLVTMKSLVPQDGNCVLTKEN